VSSAVECVPTVQGEQYAHLLYRVCSVLLCRVCNMCPTRYKTDNLGCHIT